MLTAIIVVFVIGYLAIALEHLLHINKAASALFMGILCWSIYMVDGGQLKPLEAIPAWFQEAAKVEQIENVKQHFLVENELIHLTGEIASVLLFFARCDDDC